MAQPVQIGDNQYNMRMVYTANTHQKIPNKQTTKQTNKNTLFPESLKVNRWEYYILVLIDHVSSPLQTLRQTNDKINERKNNLQITESKNITLYISNIIYEQNFSFLMKINKMKQK